MDIQVDIIQTATDMPECVSVAEIQQASSLDNHLQQLKGTIITGWPDSRVNYMQTYSHIGHTGMSWQ